MRNLGWIRWICLQAIPIIIAAVVIGWIIRDDPPTKVFSVEALPRNAQPGEQLTLHFEGIRYRACPVVSHEEIIDSAGNHFPVQARLGNPERKNGAFQIVVKVPVPENAVRGLATYRSIATYNVDFLKGCFATHVIGPPERPEAKFWIGDLPQWMTRRVPN